MSVLVMHGKLKSALTSDANEKSLGWMDYRYPITKGYNNNGTAHSDGIGHVSRSHKRPSH